MFTQFVRRTIRRELRAFINDRTLTTHNSQTAYKTASSKFCSKSMFFSGLGLSLLTIMPLVLPNNSTGLAHAASVESTTAGLMSSAILSKVPSDKATVGVIPYYINDGQVYILLGRERIDGFKKEKSGKFSDFGGSVELDGTTFAHNAVRELKEETMGQINLTEQDLFDHGKVLYTVSSKNRAIIYVFYPMSEHEYKRSKSLNSLWPVMCSNKADSVDCEKDQFTWFNLHDISNRTTPTRDIDGNTRVVQLREFFVQDCLEHPDFSKMVEHISCTTASSRCENSLG